MANLNIKIDMGEVLANFEKVPVLLSRHIPVVLQEVGNHAFETVKRFTPVDTGTLESGWTTTGVIDNDPIYTYTITNEVHYVYYVENGFMMDSHFVPNYLLDGFSNKFYTGGGFVSPSRFFVGRFMARDTSRVIEKRIEHAFEPVVKHVVELFG